MCMRVDSRQAGCAAADMGARMRAIRLPGSSSHPLAYPALEVVHIVGIALLLGNLVLFELRVWGFGAASCRCRRWRGWRCACRWPASRSSARSGLLMFAGQPAELLANRGFVDQDGPGDAGRAERRRCSTRAAACSGSTAPRGRRPCCRWGFGWLSSSAAAGLPTVN